MSKAIARRGVRSVILASCLAAGITLASLSASVAASLGPITFGAHAGYSGGAAPIGIAVFDANRDGALDVVQTSDAGGSTRVDFLGNNGSGGLLSAVHSECGLRTTSITHADFDRDGDEDVAVCGPYASTVAVGYGDGLGNFTFSIAGTTDATPTSVIAGDWNRDGAPDLAVADTARVKVFMRSGSGFAAPTTATVGIAPTRLASADIDRDGDIDLLAGGESSVSVLKNNGTGAYSEFDTIDIAETVAALTTADFDGDRVSDLAVGGSDGGIEIWRGLGAGSFDRVGTVSAADAPYQLSVADLDFDGDLDLAGSLPGDDRVEVFSNDAAGGFSSVGRIDVGNSPAGLSLSPMDRDGRADIVVANTAHGSVGVAMNMTLQLQGVGFSHGVQISTPGNPWAATSGDFNRDGHPDIATVERYANNLEVLLGDGTGSLAVTSTVPVGLYPTAVECGDIDRDGVPDLVVSNGNFDGVAGEHKVSVLLGDGDGDFAAQPARTVGVRPMDVALGDFDRDGTLDLCTANSGSGNVSVRLGDGAGGFSAGSDVGSLSNPVGLRVADFNRDGKLDIATVNYNDNSVAVLLGNGSGGFTQTDDTVVPDAQSVCTLDVGDFDEDGVTDVAVGDYRGRVARLLGTGSGTFDASAVATVGASLGRRTLKVADIDSDGRDDIVITSETMDEGCALLGDGDGGFAAPVVVSEGQGISPVVVDLNADGRLDLVDSALFSGRVSVALGDTWAPVTTLSFSGGPNGPDGWYTGAYQPYIKLETDESAARLMQYDATASAGWEAAPDGWFPMTTEGTHTLYYFSADSLGNTETVRGQVIKWDNSPPAGTAAIADGAAYVGSSTVSIDSTLTDVVDARFSNGWGQPWSAWEPYSKHRLITLNPPTGEGSRFAFAEYCDDHGLVRQFELETHIDLGAPACTAYKTPDTEWSNAATVSVDIATWDMSGIQSVTYEIDGGVTETFTVPLEFTSECSHTITYRARDNAGNSSETKSISVKVDHTNPTPVTLSCATNPTSSAGWGNMAYAWIDLAGHSDAFSGVKGFSVTVTTGTPSVPDNVIDEPAVSNHVVAWLDTDSEGVPWYIGIRVVDNAGNMSDTTYYGPVARETVNPTVSCSLDGTWHSQPVTATISVEDTMSGPGRITYNLGGIDHDYIGPIGFAEEGSHGLQYYGWDLAGNWGYGYTAVNLDFTAPTAAFMMCYSHTAGEWSTDPIADTHVSCVEVPGHGVESGMAGYSSVWSNSPTPTVDASIEMFTDQTQTVLPDGIWYQGARGIDVAGNAGAAGYFGPILIDTTPPTTTVAPDSAWRSGPADVVLTPTDAGSGVARTLLSVGGAEAEATTTAHITAEGTTTIEFRSEDNLGHAETTQTATIRIDDSAPTVACAAAATYTDGAVLAISASDPYSGVASVAYRLDAGATQTVAAAFASAATSVWGDHTLRYVATDALGHESDAQVASFRVVPSVVTPRVVRSPSAWSKTVKRKRGVARYTLKITVTRPSGVPISALGVRIQTSKNGRTGWKNAYWLRTDSRGVVSKAFSTKKRATRYYRWYLSSSYQSRALYTTKQRIIIK